MAGAHSIGLSHYFGSPSDPIPQPSIFVSCPAPFAADIHSTLLHLFMQNMLVQLQHGHLMFADER